VNDVVCVQLRSDTDVGYIYTRCDVDKRAWQDKTSGVNYTCAVREEGQPALPSQDRGEQERHEEKDKVDAVRASTATMPFAGVILGL